MRQKTFAKKVIDFNNRLSCATLNLPDGYRVLNPYKEDKSMQVKKAVTLFYQKYYNDTRIRRLILGSSPARRGSAVTGVPFEDAGFLQDETGIFFENFHINRSSNSFLSEVIEKYGGREKFYANFYMNFVCPLGLVRINSNGKEVNCNYYEYKKLQDALFPFIISTIQSQIGFGIDTSVCYCIGSGENYRFLCAINKMYNFFDVLVPLEHPRYIMQYNSKQKNIFLEKYIKALRNYKN